MEATSPSAKRVSCCRWLGWLTGKQRQEAAAAFAAAAATAVVCCCLLDCGHKLQQQRRKSVASRRRVVAAALRSKGKREHTHAHKHSHAEYVCVLVFELAEVSTKTCQISVFLRCAASFGGFYSTKLKTILFAESNYIDLQSLDGGYYERNSGAEVVEFA